MIYKLFEIVQILLFGSFLLVTLAGLIHGIFLDKLLKYQYFNHKMEWENDGSMNGVFWTAPESKAWQSFFRATKFIDKKWASERPQWVYDDVKATELYNSFRRSRRILIVFVSLMLSIVCIFLAFKMAGFD